MSLSKHLDNIDSISKTIEKVKSVVHSYNGGYLSALALRNSVNRSRQLLQKLSKDLDAVDMFLEHDSAVVSKRMIALAPEYTDTVNTLALKVSEHGLPYGTADLAEKLCRLFIQEYKSLLEQMHGKLRDSDAQQFKIVSSQVDETSDQMLISLLRTIGKVDQTRNRFVLTCLIP